MSNDFNFGSQSPNPYASPAAFDAPRQSNQPDATKIIAPGIALIVVGVLGFCASVYNTIYALTVTPEIDPNAPEIIRQMQEGSAGMSTAILQGVFCLVNLLIIFGGVQMVRISSWGLAVAASIVAMVNIGTCCCIVGLPIGIWSVVILMQEDVKQYFQARSSGR